MSEQDLPEEREESPDSKQAPIVDEYDYTAQILLQAPQTPHALKGLRSREPHPSRSPKAAADKSRRSFFAKHFSSFWRISLGLGLALFFLSYGIATLFSLRPESFLPSLGRFMDRDNILLSLFFIALISSIVTTLLTLLFPRIAKMSQGSITQEPAAKADPSSEGQSTSERTLSEGAQGSQEPDDIAKPPRPKKGLQRKEKKAGMKTSIRAIRSIKPTAQGDYFFLNLTFLLRKKRHYYLQILSALTLALFSCTAAVQLVPGNLFGMLSLFFALLVFLFLVLLRNQYIQSMEALFQSVLQQVYQPSSPTNSYNQLNAINLLYALAFAEAGQFKGRVITEFQNILKLSRSSWYQTKYTNTPSILVEEVLRKLLSAIDFRQVLQQDYQVRHKPHLLYEWFYYALFLKNFQTFRMFCDHVTISLLSHMESPRQGTQSSQSPHGPQSNPHFTFESYYLVGVNLSQLRIKEAHFQNCQLSHSDWTNSELSDCSISSSHLDQLTLYRSSWRRFLWTANTAREIDAEYCSFLQGNIKYCKLQGIQSPNHWNLQHCLLQECDLSHSILPIDTWQSVQASHCDWTGTILSLAGELYQSDEEGISQITGNHLQVKS